MPRSIRLQAVGEAVERADESLRSRPRSRARWLRVPPGRTRTGCRARRRPTPRGLGTVAAGHADRLGAVVDAWRARVSRSSSGPRTIARCAPLCLRTRSCCSTLPPPDLGFISSTGVPGDSTACQRRCLALEDLPAGGEPTGGHGDRGEADDEGDLQHRSLRHDDQDERRLRRGRPCGRDVPARGHRDGAAHRGAERDGGGAGDLRPRRRRSAPAGRSPSISARR